MKKVLIVEDDAMIGDNLVQIIELLGYEALPVATTYQEAIVFFERFSPDFVTLDIDLKSDKTGIDVAEYIRSKGDTSFLFLTAQTGECLMKRAAETEPSAYLSKPFTISEIKNALNNAFEEKAGRGANQLKP